MSAAKQDDQFGGHASLAEALAAFQADMPSVPKNSRNNFGTYADLADVARVGHPLLAKHGLSFSSKPTLNAEGVFVLAYALRHVGGDVDEGEFPLPASNTMQAIGGSVTYARRYALCAVTGLVADEDTDARDNAQIDTGHARQAKQRRNGASQQRQQPPADTEQKPDSASGGGVDQAEQSRKMLQRVAERNGWDWKGVLGVFETQHGETLDACGDAAKIQAFMRSLAADPDHVLAGAKS